MAAAEGLPHDLVFVDLETTGGNAAYDRITEVGLVRIAGGELVEEWSSLVNPGRSIPPYIEAFTGISNSMVADAPRFADIAAVVRDKLHGAVFVAHNARFDYSFLRSEFSQLGVNFSATLLCTVKLSRRLFPEFVRHNLDAVMERNGLACSARHRALGDARVLLDFWSKLRREVPDPQLAAAVGTVLGAHKLPAHLPPGLADELPDGPGVYRFLGEDEALLYVGRSNSLRARVCRHFSGQDAAGKDARLGALVRRVDWVETAGELGAMLLEAQWIKVHKPPFNRRAKAPAQSFTLRVEPADAGGAARTARVQPVDDMEPQELMQCFGVFHSEKDARKALGDIARSQHLCLKVLGFEDGAGSCLGFQTGHCKGACVGKEPALLHDMRLQLALSALKLKAWPFPGRIALRERDFRSTEMHVVDRWAYLGTARSDEELAALRAPAAGAGFDAGVYRILVRYLAKHPQPDWIDLRGRIICT
jgi:DNA polymerase-3 subunit epsilon